MQHHWWKKSRVILTIVLSAFITACGSDEPVELTSGFYLPHEINVQFLNHETAPTTTSEIALKEEIIYELTNSYFTIELPMMHHFNRKGEASGIITPENLVLSQVATFQLTPQRDHIIQVESQDYGQCREAQCVLTFTLTKVDANDAKILELQKIPTIFEEIEEPQEIPADLDIFDLFTTSFWGVVHEISDDLTLKLTPIQSNGLIYGIPEHTEMSPFPIGDITIDPKDPNIEILSFYSNAMPSSDVHHVDTISYLFILPMIEAPSLDLVVLDTENQHLFADKENLLAKDITGFYSIQYRYFPTSKKLAIALTESLTLENILEHFQAINTLQSTLITDKESSAKDKGANASTSKEIDDKTATQDVLKTILLTDISLPLKELQSRYQITLAQMFRIDNIYENYQNELKRLLTSEDLFLKDGPKTQNGYHLFTQHFGDYQFNETYLKIHNESLKNVIAAVKTLNNNPDADTKNNQQITQSEVENTENEELKGLWKSPIYLYSTDPKEASGISYFKEIQPGVTLEIFSPAFQGHVAEKVLFSKLLSNMPLKNLPKLSKVTIKNIAKYQALPPIEAVEKNPIEDGSQAQESEVIENEIEIKTNVKTEAEKASFYEFEEGKTNLQGELIKE